MSGHTFASILPSTAFQLSFVAPPLRHDGDAYAQSLARRYRAPIEPSGGEVATRPLRRPKGAESPLQLEGTKSRKAVTDSVGCESSGEVAERLKAAVC